MPLQSFPHHYQSLAVRPRFPSNFETRKIHRVAGHCHVARLDQKLIFSPKIMATKLPNQQIERVGINLCIAWSFLGGSSVVIRPRVARCVSNRKDFGVHASWLTGPQLANSVFSLGTIVVLPFYTLMVFAPKAELTRKSMESSIPYVVLGLLYAYLLYLSWTSDTIRLMFSSRYLLPELPGIAKMFSSEMTLASAWIHLLVVDLFAARQVFRDGLENDIETRHSVSLCLLFCPIGILSHAVTKALSQITKTAGHET